MPQTEEERAQALLSKLQADERLAKQVLHALRLSRQGRQVLDQINRPSPTQAPQEQEAQS